MDEHLRQLGRALVDPAAGAEARLRFVARFVRAGAADPPPTERLLAFVDDLVGARRRTGRRLGSPEHLR
jgi:hypothetical protein